MSDASAAIAIANRIGIGKVRHIEVSQLWLQQQVHRCKIEINKDKGEVNLADALTKYIDGKSLKEHTELVHAHVDTSRQHLAPALEYENQGDSRSSSIIVLRFCDYHGVMQKTSEFDFFTDMVNIRRRLLIIFQCQRV